MPAPVVGMARSGAWDGCGALADVRGGFGAWRSASFAGARIGAVASGQDLCPLLSAVGVAAASENSASTLSVPTMMTSLDVVFILEGVVVQLCHISPFASEAPPNESSDSGSGSGNGDVLGCRILLGGIAFGALVWRRSLLAAVGCYTGLPMREPFLSGQPFLSPVVEEVPFCLPSSVRRRWSGGGLRLCSGGLFIQFLCMLFVRIFHTAFLE